MDGAALSATDFRAMTFIESAVEGHLDAAVAKCLIANTGAATAREPFENNGREDLLERVAGYASAARYTPWLVICDLDRDACAPGLIARHQWDFPPKFCFRVAVRSIESWLMADAEIARFLSVRQSALPPNPDAVPDPKRFLIHLARSSRSADIRETIGGPAGTHQMGSAYNLKLRRFVEEIWNPRRAARRSDSLRRALDAIDGLAAQ